MDKRIFLMSMTAAVVVACSSPNSPSVEPNPHPEKSYAVAVTVNGYSGNFDRIEAKAFYQVANEACAPLMPVSGARDIPRREISLRLIRQLDGSLAAKFVLDPFIDADYFGKGTCHWEFTSIGVSALKNRKTFLASFDASDLAARQTARNYFLAENLRDDSKPMNIGGMRNTAAFAPGIPTFTIDVTAKEATHVSDNR